MGDLGTFANIAEIIGVIIVVGGVAFAVVQIRDFRRQRFELATIEAVRTFQSPELNRAFRVLQGLPDGFSIHDMGKFESDVQDAVLLVATTYESLGVLVHRRVVSLDLVGELMGGSIQTAWAKTEPFTLQLRDAVSRPNIYEWFQWLAEQLRQQGYFDKQPAYLAYADWRPRRK